MRILLTGIAGRLGRLLAAQLAQAHTVIGIDRRPALGLPAGVVHHRIDLRRASAERVFAEARPDAVIHLGLVHNVRIGAEQLYTRNVVGTETLLRWATQYDVRRVILLSSADVYGPSPVNSHFISEDAPLMASQRFPEVRTLVAVDRAVQSFFWRHPQLQTVILRPAHIVGPSVRNAPSNYLRLRLIPTQMGFDPMLQLIHEEDVCRYVVAALAPAVRGVYNIAGSAPVPLSRIIAAMQKPSLPIPHLLFRAGLRKLWRWHLTSFPPPELDHIRFSTVLDTRRAAAEFDVQPQRLLSDILASFRRDAQGDASVGTPL
jgi:UDP-glucose 4-epimerase